MPTDSVQNDTGGSGGAPGDGTAPEAPLEKELGGNLPCAVCGYNLRGLSIRFVCPECGTPVRATILAVVDPLASELQPIRWPALMAGAMVVWPLAALVAALLGWAPHLSDLLRVMGASGVGRPEVALPMAWSLVVSGLAALMLIRPHGAIPMWKSVLALLAVAAYVPLVMLVNEHQMLMEGTRAARYLGSWRPTAQAMRLGGAAAVMIGVMALLIRPMARVMVARSLLLRSGRVDRQTLYALAAAAGIMGVGYACGWGSIGNGVVGGRLTTGQEVLKTAALILITLGSMLVTLGLLGCVVDSVRIAMAIVQPGPSLKQVLHGPATGSAPVHDSARTIGESSANVSGGGRAPSAKRARPTSDSGGEDGGGGLL